ncbi:MAG: carboxyl-terminal processing protease [Granulosicoccus sp.]|jgi:carboxyl-terminal processing protease
MQKAALLIILLSFTVSATWAQRSIQDEQRLKFDDILNYMEAKYVDSVDLEPLLEQAVRAMVEELDPHSEYMTADEYKKMNEPLAGNFEGIGIQFNIIKDTIAVVSPISGGPSEALGIRSGDKIVTIEDTTVAGIGVTNRDVIKKLRGDKGTIVNVGIYRRGVPDLLKFAITRDKIPIFSIDASYLLNAETGYIKLNRFSHTSMDEYNEAMDKLLAGGMKNLVLDLRGNSGGYLKTAIELADEFLESKELIVYTEGVSSPRRENVASSSGRFEKGKLVVLINEGSASASEIVSGAVQDHDRGLVIGRRSFGKGLVQRPFKLRDGSVLKLTTARYYTPSGRCIQRPYDEGEEAYRKENRRRKESGELFHKDSVEFDESQRFETDNKRTVYGGGGVMPDIFIPLDTSENSDLYVDLWSKGLFNQFVNEHVDVNRKQFKEDYPDFESFSKGFVVDDSYMEEFIDAAKAEEIEVDSADLAISGHLIRTRLKALTARSLWKTQEYFRVINSEDEVVQKALEAIDDKTFKKLRLSYN